MVPVQASVYIIHCKLQTGLLHPGVPLRMPGKGPGHHPLVFHYTKLTSHLIVPRQSCTFKTLSAVPWALHVHSQCLHWHRRTTNAATVKLGKAM